MLLQKSSAKNLSTSNIKFNHTIKHMYLHLGKMYKYSSLDEMRRVTEIFKSKLVYQLPMFYLNFKRPHYLKSLWISYLDAKMYKNITKNTNFKKS